MARKIILKQNGLSGQPDAPNGYKYIGYNGDSFSEKSGSTITTIDGYKYTEVVISNINDLLNTDITLGVELLPAPGVNKYYNISMINIESTITTPFQIFSGQDEDTLVFFPISIWTFSQQIGSLQSSNLLTTSMSFTIKTGTPGLITDTGTISLQTPGANLENKSVNMVIYDHDDGDFLSPHTLTGTGSLLVKIWYNEITKGSQL